MIKSLSHPVRSVLSEPMTTGVLQQNYVEFKNIYKGSLSKKLEDLTDSEKATIAIMNGREWEIVSGGMIGIVKAKPVIPIERLIFKKVRGEWVVKGELPFTYPPNVISGQIRYALNRRMYKKCSELLKETLTRGGDIEEFSWIIEHLEEEYHRIVKFFREQDIPVSDYYPTDGIITLDKSSHSSDKMYPCRVCGCMHVSENGSKRCRLLNRQ